MAAYSDYRGGTYVVQVPDAVVHGVADAIEEVGDHVALALDVDGAAAA